MRLQLRNITNTEADSLIASYHVYNQSDDIYPTTDLMVNYRGPREGNIDQDKGAYILMQTLDGKLFHNQRRAIGSYKWDCPETNLDVNHADPNVRGAIMSIIGKVFMDTGIRLCPMEYTRSYANDWRDPLPYRSPIGVTSTDKRYPFFSDCCEVYRTNDIPYDLIPIGIPKVSLYNDPYLFGHIAYSESDDGELGFSLEYSYQRFVGYYKDIFAYSSTDPKRYEWSLLPLGNSDIHSKQHDDLRKLDKVFRICLGID